MVVLCFKYLLQAGSKRKAAPAGKAGGKKKQKKAAEADTAAAADDDDDESDEAEPESEEQEDSEEEPGSEEEEEVRREQWLKMRARPDHLLRNLHGSADAKCYLMMFKHGPLVWKLGALTSQAADSSKAATCSCRTSS